MSSTTLSGNDAAVLGALFDPEASLSNTIRVEGTCPEGSSNAEFRSIQRKEREALL